MATKTEPQATAPEPVEGQPHVYGAMLNILRSLGVEKNGDLPSNMGGKPYITAADVAKETKKLFVANDLIVIPFETITKHEVIPKGDRAPNIAVVIEAQYTILSTVDGSEVAIQGVGDGLASGTAVASNIASTNAMKNALLRTFMITEQSVEDAAKNGPADDAPAVESRAVSTAKGSPTNKENRQSPKAVQDLQDQVREAWESAHGESDSGYIDLGNAKYGDPAKWSADITSLKGLLDAIKAGEVA